MIYYTSVLIDNDSVDEFSVSIREFKVLDRHVYVHLQKRIKEDSVSIGWRQGYALQSGALLSKNLDTGEVEMIYSY